MRKIIVSLAIAALTVAFATPAQAEPKVGGAKNGSVAKSSGTSSTKPTNAKTSNGSQPNLGKGIASNKTTNYHMKHGTKFGHGYFYKGKNHHHWGETRFDRRYGCNCYWDSCLSIWFYYCERDICYYPVSYCPYQCYVCPVVVVERPRPVVIVQPVCECLPVHVCGYGASISLGCVHRTGHLSHSVGRR
ncbi:MAG: hypothetical protein EXR98_20400 [Gemmataceae bacterium]|nr:hypothetical protein [Gemmataceae bacterium]